MNTVTKDVRQPIAMYVECAASDVEGGRLFLATCIDVTAIDTEKVLWESRRISLDGVRMLTYANGYVNGIGRDLASYEKPIAFSINAATGEAAGGFTRIP
jgi:hypothetical protein